MKVSLNKRIVYLKTLQKSTNMRENLKKVKNDFEG